MLSFLRRLFMLRLFSSPMASKIDTGEAVTVVGDADHVGYQVSVGEKVGDGLTDGTVGDFVAGVDAGVLVLVVAVVVGGVGGVVGGRFRSGGLLFPLSSPPFPLFGFFGLLAGCCFFFGFLSLSFSASSSSKVGSKGARLGSFFILEVSTSSLSSSSSSLSLSLSLSFAFAEFKVAGLGSFFILWLLSTMSLSLMPPLSFFLIRPCCSVR